MAKDRISLNVAHLNPIMDLDNPDAIHLVGASHLKEYLDFFYGEGIPADPQMTHLTEGVLGALAVFSTDEEAPAARHNNPLQAVPFWLQSFTPVVDRTKALGKRVGADLTGLEQRRRVGREDITNDLAYGLGVFDVASFAIANELEISHPRFKHKALVERARDLQPAGQLLAEHTDAVAFKLITQLPIIKADYRRKMILLREQGERIIDTTELYAARLRNIIERAWDEA